MAYNPKADKVKRSNRQVKSWGKYPVLVRGRLETDMKQLEPYWRKLRIETDTSADYHYRAIMPRNRFVDFLIHKGWQIDYGSHFKEVAQRRSPGGSSEGGKRHSAYMSVWGAVAKLQPASPYSGSNWGNYGYSDYSSGYNSGYSSSSSKTTYANSYKDDFKSYPSTGAKGRCVNKFISKEKGNYYVTYCSFVDKHTNLGHRYDERYEITKEQYDNTKVINDDPEFRTVMAKKVEDAKPKTSSSNAISGMPDYVSGGKSRIEYASSDIQDMCQQLMKVAPEKIDSDEATPYPVYDLLMTAYTFSPAEPLTALELVTILDELATDDMTPQQGRIDYLEAMEKLLNGDGIDLWNMSDEDLEKFGEMSRRRDASNAPQTQWQKNLKEVLDAGVDSDQPG